VWALLGLGVLTVVLGASGCAGANQVQYFEVVRENPDTGALETNYYRMTVSGFGLGAVTYKLKAAYLNAVTVDVLEGKDVFVPEADLPRSADESFQKVIKNYYDAVQERSTAVADRLKEQGSGLPAGEYENGLTQLARQVFFHSLSYGDVAAMGRTQDTNPFVFRKLVFYATAKNIDLERSFGGQVDSIIGKVGALAQRERERAEQREGFVENVAAIVDKLPASDGTNAAKLLLGLFPRRASEPSPKESATR
jgi:hypothetical protein